MKQSPLLDKVQEKMRPGRIVLQGMLGEDPRPLVELLIEDHGQVNGLGLSHERIAAFLRKLLEQARAGLGDPVAIHGLSVRVEQTRGRQPCPWADGVFPKLVLHVTHQPSDRSLKVSALGIHMIEAHGFYQGRGSSYRVEPALVAKLMGRCGNDESDCR